MSTLHKNRKNNIQILSPKNKKLLSEYKNEYNVEHFYENVKKIDKFSRKRIQEIETNKTNKYIITYDEQIDCCICQ